MMISKPMLASSQIGTRSKIIRLNNIFNYKNSRIFSVTDNQTMAYNFRVLRVSLQGRSLFLQYEIYSIIYRIKKSYFYQQLISSDEVSSIYEID